MFTRICSAVAVLAAVAAAPAARGHGTPAFVTVVDGRLTVAGNAPSTPAGFAHQLLAETIAGSAMLEVPSNDWLFTDFPGMDVSGVAVGSRLWIEPMVLDADPSAGVTPRGVWWWSPTTSEVAPLDSGFRVDLISALISGVTTFGPETPAADPLKIMEPTPGDLSNHRHPVYYIVQDGSLAPTGAFGFFARLTSPNYEPSAPFLIGLNHGLAPGQFVSAVQAINEAASRIPGDYDYDGQVTHDDYVAWTSDFGQAGADLAPDGSQDGAIDAADYTVWRDHLMAGASAAESAAAPEPGGAVLLLVGLATIAGPRGLSIGDVGARMNIG